MSIKLGGKFGATAKIGDTVEFFTNNRVTHLRVRGKLIEFDDTTVTFHVKDYFIGWDYYPGIYKDMKFNVEDINAVWYVDPKNT